MSLILCLCALYTGALAGAKEMTKYQQGQKSDVGFNGDVTFWSGWEFSDGTSFMLVDTDFFEGYLLVDSPRYYYDTIGGGSVTQTRGGQQVRIIGEYNSQWRIVGTESGSYFIHADDVR